MDSVRFLNSLKLAFLEIYKVFYLLCSVDVKRRRPFDRASSRQTLGSIPWNLRFFICCEDYLKRGRPFDGASSQQTLGHQRRVAR